LTDDIVSEVAGLVKANRWERALGRIVEHFAAESGTIHVLGSDALLHLAAASEGIPAAVLNTIREVPVGKGMAGLAVERRRPVDACNIQTDRSGDVRPGALATGLQGSIVVPMLQEDRAVGALGIANRAERTFSEDETALLLQIGRAIAASVPVSGRTSAKP
jgi:L-methionine (R)-S-oxide reductase